MRKAAAASFLSGLATQSTRAQHSLPVEVAMFIQAQGCTYEDGLVALYGSPLGSPSSSSAAQAGPAPMVGAASVPRALMPALQQQVGQPRSPYAARNKTWYDLAAPVEGPVEATFFMVLRDLYTSGLLPGFSPPLKQHGASKLRGPASSSKGHSLPVRDRQLSKHLCSKDYANLSTAWNAILCSSMGAGSRGLFSECLIRPKLGKHLQQYDHQLAAQQRTQSVSLSSQQGALSEQLQAALQQGLRLAELQRGLAEAGRAAGSGGGPAAANPSLAAAAAASAVAAGVAGPAGTLGHLGAGPGLLPGPAVAAAAAAFRWKHVLKASTRIYTKYFSGFVFQKKNKKKIGTPTRAALPSRAALSSGTFLYSIQCTAYDGAGGNCLTSFLR